MRLFRKRGRVEARGKTPVEETTIVALDIETTLVKAGLLRVEDRTLRLTKYVQVTPNTKDGRYHQTALLEASLRAIKHLLTAQRDFANQRPQSLVIGFSDVLTQSVTHSIALKRSHASITFSEKEFDALVAKNQAQALDQAHQAVERDYPTVLANLQLLNSALINLSIDGQTIADNDFRRSARRVSIQLYNVFINPVWLQLSQQIAERAHLNLITLAHRPFALTAGLLRSQTPLQVLMLNVGSQVTDVAVVQNDILTHSASFNLGQTTFLKALARSLEIDLKTARNYWSKNYDFNLAGLDVAQQQKVMTAFNHATAVWLQALNLTLTNLAVNPLPGKIYLSGLGSNLKALTANLMKLQRVKNLTFAEALRVEILTPNRLPYTISDLEPQTDFGGISLVGLGRLALDLLEIESAPQEALQTVTS